MASKPSWREKGDWFSVDKINEKTGNIFIGALRLALRWAPILVVLTIYEASRPSFNDGAREGRRQVLDSIAKNNSAAQKSKTYNLPIPSALRNQASAMPVQMMAADKTRMAQPRLRVR